MSVEMELLTSRSKSSSVSDWFLRERKKALRCFSMRVCCFWCISRRSGSNFVASFSVRHASLLTNSTRAFMYSSGENGARWSPRGLS